MPFEWAMAQNNLASALLRLGERDPLADAKSVAWTILSSRAAMPSGHCRPSGFGM
jgi:hypothetical protein